MEALEIREEGMPYGFMLWWDKHKDAVRYTVRLYIECDGAEHELSVVEKDRHTAYHTFTNLAYLSRGEYKVSVEAEGRDGTVIAVSRKIWAHVKKSNNEWR